MSGHVAEARGKAGHHGQDELEDKCKVEDGVATNKVNKEPSTAINKICARNQQSSDQAHCTVEMLGDIGDMVLQEFFLFSYL